jgi:uncharacterized membrane protein YoaK (UPF0700 family)
MFGTGIKKYKQTSDTFRLGILLSLAGGFTDAYTFIIRGNVFANAQTGNIVLLGLKLVNAQWKEASFYIFPILAFVLGILAAEFIRTKFKNKKWVHWRQVVILIEILVLFLSAFIPQGNYDIIVNTAVSFICSLQVESFRKINGNLSATTMCTGNLRSGTEQLYKYILLKDKTAKEKFMIYYGLILFFIIGAVLGSFFTEILREKALFACCGILLAVFAIMFKDEM